MSFAVIVLSVSGDTVRQFMLKAHEIGYAQSGDYVFIDVELFQFSGEYWGDHHWRRHDQYDDQAKEAYESLLRIALYQPNTIQYQQFSAEVKARSWTDYGFNYTDEEVRKNIPMPGWRSRNY